MNKTFTVEDISSGLSRYMREDRDLQEKMAEQGIRLSSTKQSNFRANKY